MLLLIQWLVIVGGSFDGDSDSNLEVDHGQTFLQDALFVQGHEPEHIFLCNEDWPSYHAAKVAHVCLRHTLQLRRNASPGRWLSQRLYSFAVCQKGFEGDLMRCTIIPELTAEVVLEFSRLIESVHDADATTLLLHEHFEAA